MDGIASAAVAPRCRLCTCRLHEGSNDDLDRALCGDCINRPEARRLGHTAPRAGGARSFTPTDKSLIKSVSGYMPARQLLKVLNERLAADLGPDAQPYTMEQLHAEIGSTAAPANAGDWAGLRKLLATARREGVLDLVTAQVIDDFAVVFSLSSAQVLLLKDVVLAARENSR